MNEEPINQEFVQEFKKNHKNDKDFIIGLNILDSIENLTKNLDTTQNPFEYQEKLDKIFLGFDIVYNIVLKIAQR